MTATVMVGMGLGGGGVPVGVGGVGMGAVNGGGGGRSHDAGTAPVEHWQAPALLSVGAGRVAHMDCRMRVVCKCQL